MTLYDQSHRRHLGNPDCQGGICNHKGWQMIVYTWKITDLLPVLSNKSESGLADVYILKHLEVLATGHKRN